jgi:hypothetical protein
VANPDIVLPGHLYAAPDRAEALDIVRRNRGVFGTGGTPAELLRVLEWFVDPSACSFYRMVHTGSASLAWI